VKKILLLIPLLFLPLASNAQCNAAFGSPCTQDQLQGQAPGQAQGQAQGQAAIGVGVSGSGVVYAPNIAAAKIPNPAAMAPNPNAAPPSASCWIGASVTAAISEFGIGVSGMEWDPICGLWLAAQQVAGEPQKEAATAAYCMTMAKAKVQSVSCVDWSKDQTLMANLITLDPDNRASVNFSGSGTSGYWGR
jgi:hypothetical protein